MIFYGDSLLIDPALLQFYTLILPVKHNKQTADITLAFFHF